MKKSYSIPESKVAMSALKAFCSSSSSKLKLLPFDNQSLSAHIFYEIRQIVAGKNGKIEIKNLTQFQSQKWQYQL